MHRKFDEDCGLVKVKDKETWFVVYVRPHYYDSDDSPLGPVIARGKCENEALINAVKYLNKKLKMYQTEITKITDIYENLERVDLKEVVYPLKDPNWHEEDGKEEFFNADVFLNKNDEPILGIF
jgi:hypothetical protein